MPLSEQEKQYWNGLKTKKQNMPAKQKKVRRNADGRTARSQRLLEKHARMVYEHDRDFAF